MLELQIKHEFDKYYLVTEYDVEESTDYLIHMITENNIKGHLSCRISYDGCKNILMYDVTNMISLSSMYENKYLELNDLNELFEDIKNIFAIGARHLLDDQYYYLNPQYIYKDMEEDEIKVLYIPVKIERNINRYYDLADFLLQRINRKDDSCIQLAYQFYRMSSSETFSIPMFLNIIEKETTLNRKHVSIQIEKPIEPVIENIGDKEETARIKLGVPLVITVIELLFIALYYVVFKRGIYSIYSLIITVFMGIVSFYLWISELCKFVINKKENEIVMPTEPVTVEEYWSDEETVLLQDNTAVIKEAENDSGCRLEWKENGVQKKHEIKKYPIIIGKMSGEVDCFINDTSISRLHAKIVKRGNEIILFDLNSTNGTFIDGIRLQAGQEKVIYQDSKIKLGNIVVSIIG